MAVSAYLERLTQLRENKMQDQAKNLGLPLDKPLSQNAGGMAGSPMPNEPQQPGADMSSMFGRTIQDLQGSDRRFDKMFKDLNQLASGLREEVKAGFMPEVIAQQKVQQYVQDSQKWFSQNEPGMMDNPQMYNAIEGVLAQKMGGQPQGAAPQQGAPAPQAPQGAPQGGM